MEKIKNKRGRKPKGKIVDKIFYEQDNTTPIIAHLPISINTKNNNIIDNKNKEINILKNKIKELENKKNDEQNLLFTLSEDNIKNTKCWWCRYSFESPQVCLPETIFRNKIKSFGVFCSYNCALSYNINLNDENISKRSSLLNYLYKKTYNKNVEIIKAPDWKILQDYGGPISIDEYRKNFILNSFEYNYIKPPFISRIYQIEKINKNKKKPKKNDLVLKRSKPLNTSKYSLESTMGLKKVININSE